MLSKLLRKILRVRVILSIAILSLLGASFVFQKELLNLVPVREVQLSLAQRFDHPQFMGDKLAELRQETNLFLGSPMLSLNLAEVRQRFVKWNWIAEVDVYRKWPDRLMIEVRPKQIVGLTLNKIGRLMPVLDDATIMEPVVSGNLPDVPVFVGEVFQKRTDILVKAMVILEQVPSEGLFSRKNIAEVHYDSKKGLVFQTVDPSLEVLLGEEQVGIKSARVNQVIDYIRNRNLQARVIDANLTKKVLVRLRKDI